MLDGEIQSAEKDEWIYHEALVHPALVTHSEISGPKKVLILGGGEGATVREVLKHKTVESVTMVDIDPMVIEIAKKYLTTWSYDGPRLRLILEDAKSLVEEDESKYDVIISDLSSPVEGGASFSLYTEDFYKNLSKRLNKNGIFVTQAASGNFLQLDLYRSIQEKLRKIFEIVRPFYAYVPSYEVPWAFLMASNILDPFELSQEQIDWYLNENVQGDFKFYDAITHIGLFHVPKYYR